jgi:hypothetical protein
MRSSGCGEPDGIRSRPPSRRSGAAAAPLPLGSRQDVSPERVRHAPPALADGARARRGQGRGARRARGAEGAARRRRAARSAARHLLRVGVAYDGITFKNQLEHLRRGRIRQLREHVGFKLAALLRGRLAGAADARELLFGDDWESDPLTYSLYADVLDGTLERDALAEVLDRIGVDPQIRPEVHTLAGRAAGLAGVERIFINLERRTPPAVFRLYGARVVPTFNYFQTALVLAAEGYVDPDDVGRVARSLVERSAYTPRRLENSLGDLVRRRLLGVDAASALARPLREAGLLPEVVSRRSWLARALHSVRRAPRLAPALPRVARATPLDYDTILDRLEAAKEGA